jgi:hypothetical protein
VFGYRYPVPAATNVNPQIVSKPVVEVIVKEKTVPPFTTTEQSVTTTVVPSTTKPKVKEVPAVLLKQAASAVAEVSTILIEKFSLLFAEYSQQENKLHRPFLRISHT